MMTLQWFKTSRLNKKSIGHKTPLLRNLRNGVFLFYILTLLIVTSVTLWLSIQDYRNTLTEAERRSLSLARSLDEHVTRSFISVEQAMQNLTEDFERAGGVAHIDERWAYERLKSKVALTPQIRAIIAIDAKGILTAHGLEFPTRRVDLSDRNYFAYHRDKNDIRLRIGEPIVSRTDYKWLIPVTRRINNPDNSFGGVMLSGVEPDYFLRFYDSLHLDRNTRIQVLRSDGVILLNFPLDITQLGKNLRETDPESFSSTQTRREEFIKEPLAKGDESLFIAQVASQDLPVIVRVLTDSSYVLEKFTQDTLIRIASAFLILLTLTGALLVLLRQINRVQRSEARLYLTQFAVDESPDMIWWCDSNTRVRYANKCLAETSQYSADELLELSFIDLIGNADLRWEKLLAELKIHRRLNIENVLRCKNGNLLPIDLTLALIFDQQREYISLTARDITERHAAQRELHRHRDHLQELVTERTAEIRTMLDANPLAVMLSVKDHIQLVNPAFEALFGYNMNSLSGLPENLIHASSTSHNTVRSAIKSRITLGGTYRGEAELRRNDGATFWAMLFARAVQPEDAERGVIFIIEDVSAQRAAALALRQSEQLKRSVLDTTSDGFALVDTHRHFIDVNHALCQQLGMSRIALLGQTPEAIWGSELAQKIFPTQNDDPTQEQKKELLLPFKNGQKHPFLVSAGFITNEHGLVEHSFAFLTDIAHQKETEHSLLEAKEQAERANQAKSLFLTNMSHELRTPMHAILSFSDMGLQKLESGNKADLARYFERIQHSGRRLLSLLNDLLDMSRMEADKMSYERSSHYLQNTVQVAAAELSSLLSAKQLKINISDSLPKISAIYDRVRITQVVINLLSNAIRFSPPGASIYIQFLGPEETQSTQVGFTVHDEGPGIPEAELERIFDSFEQSSHTQPVGGTGLGLTISRRIIQDHAGTIYANNHPDGGAIFTVLLPREIPTEAES